MAFPTHTFMFHSLHEDQHDRLPLPVLPPTPLTNLPSCPTQKSHGGAPYMMKRSMSFSVIENKPCDEGHGEDELSDDGYSQLGEKKKRLSLEQVKALEKSFELGNKIELERKLQLAKALGMQPRQIAIWFQNRRARWKTKQLEKDYEVLKNQFETLNADNDALRAQNKKLHEELLALEGGDSIKEEATKGKKKEKEGTWSNGSDNSSDLNLEMSRNPVIQSSVLHSPNLKKRIPSTTRPTAIAHFLQDSTRSDLHGLKLDDMVREEGFCNMFNGIDEQQHNFWPWTEQQQQRFH